MNKNFSPVIAIAVVLFLAACTPKPAPTPTPPSPPTALATPNPTPTPAPPAPTEIEDPGLIAPPPLSFEARTYTDDDGRFALDYPADWALSRDIQIGPRGSTTQIFSPGASAENLPPGATRAAITIYKWDPKNDLAAYAAHRKDAWTASGFAILSESAGMLADGRECLRYVIQTGVEQRAFYQFSVLGEDYIEVSGEGGLDLVLEIASTLRPVNFQP